MDKNSFSNIQQTSDGLLVIDGDWLAFKVAAVLEKKEVKVYTPDGDYVKNFKTRTAFKNSSMYDETFEIRDSQELKKGYENTMAYLLQELVRTFLKATHCNRVLVALGGKGNFRNELPLPQKYKGNREGGIRPLALGETRDKIPELFPTVYSENEEADDIISKYQFLSTQKPEDRIVVCTLDKDARGTPGALYNPDKNTLVDIQGLGFLKLDKGSSGYKLYGEGRKWFYSQILTGDKADNYFPCDIFKQKTNNATKSPIITALKCYNMLEPCKSDAECLKVIRDQFYEWYHDMEEWTDWKGNTIKGNWVDVLQMYVDCVHMRRFDEDRINIQELLAKFGLLK